MRAIFRLPRPLKYSRAKYLSGVTPTPAHTTKPDLDKLARALKDALRGAAYEDDSQVDALEVTKRYARVGEPWGVRVAVHREDDSDTNTPSAKRDPQSVYTPRTA